MKKLEERILKEGRALSKEVLKVDSFLNHAVDTKLMYDIGEEFKKYFENHNITKIFTIESSGIAPAAMTALQMNLPMVILKKQSSKILNGDTYQTTVHSFTKNSDYELTLSKKYINENDNILIIATSIGLGLGVTFRPDFISNLPQGLNMIFASGISTGTITAIVLNLILREK